MISVIIPVYNRSDVLHQSLISLKAQTYKDIEVILVDDGSTPLITLDVSLFPFSFQIFRQKNAGAPAARNTGFKHAKGEFVIFWDADVIANSDMLEKMVQALEQHETSSFSYSNVYFGKKKMPAQAFNTVTLQQRNYIHTTSLIRRDAVIVWDESIQKFQDWDFFLSLMEAGKSGVWIDEYLFRFESGGTVSQWLPRIAYHAPFKWLPGIVSKVKKYEDATAIIQKKHHLSSD
ncbi:MAG: hypothetical protein CO029_03920 [Candidatus Magasanikbacteria bacterium CG_4_9_14_0_2_um_filter_41_10]|uniref:Glycosyltransferase 2-like domain-containing protein n=1 Tax=Candidatus Magasanikbacteria bacterium CG_4_10_14_0_2_um_filter_41_31 TaxID=1974639 RepID=A0A2M7V4D0_9BACT|nr:MAG: hypothetical protein AUJ37_00895 [Candidatus Magasanikbacteria bacterium CG1_02_41_34]PIZ93411.1 MAG: hypothetical protein COX83_02040 [Candidatus Magasanikbacteria bacterium CG_4_10_14_0_2_um_filter_41_31]PJC53212.1 MAG: hypothetical protein CO029_03920 [Candidatus Magasanikbacteria bacterium CG_4_9_14_0_2_um_filter_41_10]